MPASLGCGDVFFIQAAGKGPDAKTFSTVQIKHPPYNLRLLVVDLIASGGLIRLADETISERGAAQHADFTGASAKSFATTRALQNLRAFVLCNHSLKLYEQL